MFTENKQALFIASLWRVMMYHPGFVDRPVTDENLRMAGAYVDNAHEIEQAKRQKKFASITGPYTALPINHTEQDALKDHLSNYIICLSG